MRGRHGAVERPRRYRKVAPWRRCGPAPLSRRSALCAFWHHASFGIWRPLAFGALMPCALLAGAVTARAVGVGAVAVGAVVVRPLGHGFRAWA